MDVEAAIRYPLDGEDAAETLLIGGGLLLLGVVISIVAVVLSLFFVGILLFPLVLVPQVFVQGYLVRVLRSTVRDGTEPPAFDEWGDLAVDGLRFVVVSVGYSLPVVVVSGLFAIALVGAFALGLGAGPDRAGATGVAVLLVAAVGGLLVLLLLLVVLYLAPAGLCAMVHEDDLTAAFDLDRLRRVGRDRDYAVAWGVGTAVMLVGNTVGQMLFVLLVGFPIVFASQVVGFRLFARGYADALDLDAGGSGPSDMTGDAPAPPATATADTAVGSGADRRGDTPPASADERTPSSSTSTSSDRTATDE